MARVGGPEFGGQTFGPQRSEGPTRASGKPFPPEIETLEESLANEIQDMLNKQQVPSQEWLKDKLNDLASAYENKNPEKSQKISALASKSSLDPEEIIRVLKQL